MKRLCLLLSVVALLGIPQAACADTPPPPSVTVSGVGKVYAKPDMAEINIGVVSQAASAAAALSANSAAMTALMNELKAAGIEDKDILTSNFSVNPVYSDQPMNSSIPRPPKIVAYRVDNSVQAKIRKIASLGTILDAVVKSGANSINGISFSVAQPEPLYDKARASAITDAKRKAEIYASAAGIKLGRVLYISEGGHSMPPPMPMTRMMAAQAESVPIATGEQELASSVQVVYAVEP